MRQIYLDNNATTQPAPQVVQTMAEAHERFWGNPSSVHRFGQMARQRVELARVAVGLLIGSQPRELIFTSGGTESNNLALWGTLDPRWVRVTSSVPAAPPPLLITTRIEHASIREPGEALEGAGVDVVYVPTDPGGWVRSGAVKEALETHARDRVVTVVSIQWANNETGVIQPIGSIAKVIEGYRAVAGVGARRRGGGRVLFHVDASQAVGKIPVDVSRVGVDLMTFSGHKFHGPKGVGVLYIRRGVRVRGLQRGGPQENELRAGTENTPGIIAMGVAAEFASGFVRDQEKITVLRGVRDRFEAGVCELVPRVVINGDPGDYPDVGEGSDGGSEVGIPGGDPSERRLWNTTNLGFAGLEAEAILLGLSERGLCASAGAACSSGSLDPSPVLLAMGVPRPVAHGSVRFSMSRWTTREEIDEAVRVVGDVITRVNKTMSLMA